MVQIVWLIAGALVGAGLMYAVQTKRRMKELTTLEKQMERMLRGETIRAEHAGEDLLIAKAEHQLVRLQEILQGGKAEAEQSRDEIQKLISQIAHQLRTPLTNVQTYTELLKKQEERQAGGPEAAAHKGRAEERELVQALEESGNQLGFLVESFIKMSRIEQQIIQIRRTETDLLKTIRNTFGQIQNQAEEKEIEFAIDLPREANYPHDANWLGEAFYNILENAVKYSDPKGTIEVSLTGSEMFWKLGVRDYGIGMEVNEENKIFQRFYRGERVGTRAGLGIGLYIAREIVGQHGGFLTAKREEPGLRMEMQLPHPVPDLLEVC